MRLINDSGISQPLGREHFKDDSVRIPTPLPSLSTALGGGIKQGGITIIAGRPGTGKSALAEQFTQFYALCGRQVIFWGVEMGKDEHFLRMEARHGARVINLPVTFVDIPSTGYVGLYRNMMGANDALREEFFKGAIFVIDFIQCVKGFGDSDRETLKIAMEMTSELCVELDMAGLVLSQMNRNIEYEHAGKARKVPKMSDLEGGGALEQFTDAALLLTRPSVASGIPCTTDFERTQMWIPKSRGAGVGMVEVDFHGATQTFHERETR